MNNVLDLTFKAIGCDDPVQQEHVIALLARAGVRSHEVQQSEPFSAPQLVALNPMNIATDPDTYQFRSQGDCNGVTRDGCYTASKWDPILHGDPLLVHERLDGTLYVADGHHRLDLAKRLRAEGHGPETVAAQILREADGYSPHDVKIIAAYKNLQHGNVDAIDAAQVLKEAKQVDPAKLSELPMDKGTLPDAAALAQLPDDAFAPVAAGEVPKDMGMTVATQVAPEQQSAVMRSFLFLPVLI